MTHLAVKKTSVLPSLFDDVFDNLISGLSLPDAMKYQKTPQYRIKNFDDRREIYVSLPGVNKEEINLDVKNHYLTISVETKSEFSYSSFSKSLYLPEYIKISEIKAKQENGILTVVLPKEKEESGKKIQVE